MITGFFSLGNYSNSTQLKSEMRLQNFLVYLNTIDNSDHVNDKSIDLKPKKKKKWYVEIFKQKFN